jgi:hypothetical protein
MKIQRNDIFVKCYRKDALRRGVYGMGFNSPSKIQETALPMLLADPYVNVVFAKWESYGSKITSKNCIFVRKLKHIFCFLIGPVI